jgi:AcrR family transcriptional regulator
MTPHRPRVTGDREDEILEATVRVLADVGYDRLTMDQVAAEAHASKATLYRRWDDKASLVVDAVSRAKGLPEARPPDTGSLRGDLLSVFCGPAGVTERLPMSVQAGLLTALHTDADLSVAWRERFLAPRMAVATDIFRRARDRGEVSPDADLDVLQTVLPSMCAFRRTVLGHDVDADFVASVIDTVVLPAARPATPPAPTSARTPTPTSETSKDNA